MMVRTGKATYHERLAAAERAAQDARKAYDALRLQKMALADNDYVQRLQLSGEVDKAYRKVQAAERWLRRLERMTLGDIMERGW